MKGHIWVLHSSVATHKASISRHQNEKASISLKQLPIFSVHTLLYLAAFLLFSGIPRIRIYGISKLRVKFKLGSYRHRTAYITYSKTPYEVLRTWHHVQLFLMNSLPLMRNWSIRQMHCIFNAKGGGCPAVLPSKCSTHTVGESGIFKSHCSTFVAFLLTYVHCMHTQYSPCLNSLHTAGTEKYQS